MECMYGSDKHVTGLAGTVGGRPGSADRRILATARSVNNQSDGLVIFNNPTLLTVARCAHCRLADVPWLPPLVVPGT